MALSKQKIDPRLKINNDTGFGTNASSYGGRFINRDGPFNLRKEGLSFFNRFSIYHQLLNMPRWKFMCLVFLIFFFVNLGYALIYYFIGSSELTGLVATTPWGKFKEAFFFSTETFTTVGYGRVNPVGDGANVVAAIEALSGLLSFAIFAGLMFGRFSRPRSYLVFSDFALISPFRGATALMFRFAPYKDNHTLTDVQIRVNVGLKVQMDGNAEYRYYDLNLERTRVESLPMNWTVVHPIDEQSPFLGFTQEDMVAADVELYVLIRGFDDVFSNLVQQRTSYTYQEIIFNGKFVPMYRESDDGKTTILELHKLNEFVPVNVPAHISVAASSTSPAKL
ncbi:MAG TPA: ion channel [Puia sp.]|nr:ion channel [Puia sp.]